MYKRIFNNRNMLTNSIKNIIISSSFFLILAYILFHAVSGERGIISLMELNKKFNYASNELEHLRVERIEIEHKVNLMRSESLDLDLIDEQARKLLGFAHPGEKIIYLKSKN